MGNYVSCTLSGLSPKQSRGAKVILPTGEIRHYYEPINAAELMMESPNHAVVNARSLKIGRRFAALNADEDLEMGNCVYAVIPMKRLSSVVTAADFGALFLAAKRASSSSSRRSSVRILPHHQNHQLHISSDEINNNNNNNNKELPKLNLEEIEDLSVAELKQRLSICRSKKPVLETILEEPVFHSR